MANKGFQSPKGTKDILPEEQPFWVMLHRVIQEITGLYGYQQLDIPIFEETALFQRGVGEATDIVEKEMYTFIDKGGKSMTLRPEFTAGIIRSYIQHGMASRPTPVKLWSIGPIFRYERPQAGRLRQFNQFNVEALGEQDPAVDFEIMDMAWHLFDRLGFQNLSFQLNSIGCPNCRPRYLDTLVKYYQNHLNIICNDCKKRLETNPLRLLDCKQYGCQSIIEKAPAVSQTLCEDCDTHFQVLRSYLDAMKRPYDLNHRLVRGLDYYTKTVFEVWAEGIGSQNAVCGGGRYDGLAEILGGTATPAVGFAVGLERIVMIMRHQNVNVPEQEKSRVYFACQHKDARKQALIYLSQLRKAGISGIIGTGNRSLKAQFREANRREVEFVVILGDEELKSKTAAIKNMKTGEQVTFGMDKLMPYFKKEDHD